MNYFLYLARLVADALSDCSNVKAEWIYSQMAHETGGFTSELCVNYHNYGGLTQTKSNNLPQPDGDLFYMEFSTPLEFATYFSRYLRLYGFDGLYTAESLEDYVTSLKNGGYFGDSVENYLEGCRSWLATIQ